MPTESGVSSFLKANWFSIASVLFMAGSFFATLQVLAERVTDLESGRVAELEQRMRIHEMLPSHPQTDIRLTSLEQSNAQRDADDRQLRQALQMLSVNIAALCQATNARCQ